MSARAARELAASALASAGQLPTPTPVHLQRSRLPQSSPARTRTPRWLDGYQQFLGTPYSPGLCVIVDVRYVVPAAGSSAPAGWALLPVFERCGAFVASGTYHLPLFQVRDRARALARRTLCCAAAHGCVAWGDGWLGGLGAGARSRCQMATAGACCVECPHDSVAHGMLTLGATATYVPRPPQGVPGSTLLAEVAARGDPHAVMLAQIKVHAGLRGS